MSLKEVRISNMKWAWIKQRFCSWWEDEDSHERHTTWNTWPGLIQAHFMLEIRTSFRLISYWKRLMLVVQWFLWQYSRRVSFGFSALRTG
jgi:hypothetical protein